MIKLFSRPWVLITALVTAASLAGCTGGSGTADPSAAGVSDPVPASSVPVSGSGSAATPSGAGAGDPADDGTREVSTEQGDVTIPADPQKILVLNSTLTGYLYAMDVPVYGSIPRDVADTEFPALWKDEAEQDGTRRLAWSDEGFDLEEIPSLETDLIIAGGVGFPHSVALKVYDQLTEIAPTVVVDQTLITWQHQLNFLAEDVFAKPEAEKALLDAYAAHSAEVKAAIKSPPTSVGYRLMLADGRPYSIPEDADLAIALSDLGLTAATVKPNNREFELFGSGDTFELSTEQVGQLITAPTVFVLGFNGDFADRDALKANPVYAALPSFSAGRVHELPFTAFRADYYAAMALLDTVQEIFG